MKPPAGEKGALGKGEPAHEAQTLGRALRQATWLILVVTVVTFLLHHFGWLNGLETSSLDLFVRLREPVQPKYVWLVAITDDDYADPKLFGKTSPLKPEKLRELIEAITAGQPRVIGVDVDTGDSKGVRPETKSVPIVWGQRPVVSEGGHGELSVLPVLGGEQPQPTADELGVYAIPADSDGAARRYTRWLPLGHEHFAASLSWSVVKAFCKRSLADPQTAPALRQRCERLLQSESQKKYRKPQYLNFSEPRHVRVRQLTASEVLSIAGSEGWKMNAPIKGGIVLLGGTFRLSNDTAYRTPLGERSGVELQCDAIETELQGRPVTPLNEALMVLFDILGGYLLAAWHFISRRWSAVGLRVLAIPVLALVSSYFAFSSLAYWASFVPVLAGVVIHELYEHFHHHRELVRRVQELEQTVRSKKKRKG